MLRSHAPFKHDYLDQVPDTLPRTLYLLGTDFCGDEGKGHDFSFLIEEVEHI